MLEKKLFMAIKKQDFNEVKKLLESGVNVNYCLDFGETPLLYAIFCNPNNIALITLLIKHGANVNQSRKDELYPLYLACEYGNLELAKILIDFCSDINKFCSNCTPLFIAAKKGYLCIVKFLIDNGADINKPGKFNTTPIFVASQNNHLETVKFLIDNGAKINLSNINGKTPIYSASESGNIDLIKLFLNAGEEINQKNNDGETLLFIACKFNKINMVKYLIENGANVNIKNNNDVSPLWICTQSEYFDEFCVDLYKEKIKLAKILLDNGAKLI